MKAPQTNPSKTILTIVLGLLLLFVLFKYQWALITAIIIGLVGLFSDKASVAIDRIWMKLALLLSKIFPPILLGLIFYLFLFPISLLARLFRNKDELQLKNKETHNWMSRENKIEKTSFEKMW